jgi:hypothetical protein
MRISLLTLVLVAPVGFASAQIPADWRTGALTAGGWAYRETATGSEAAYTDARVTRRIVVKCSRMTRRVSLAVTSQVTAASITVATTEGERSLAATFDPQGFQIVADLPAMDAILDAIAMSRGRFAVSVPGGAALVVPAYPEIARSIEDCRL